MTELEKLPAGDDEAPAALLPATLHYWAERSPGAVALAAPGRQPLDFAALWGQVEEKASALAPLKGNGRPRLALVLPNGPELAVAFLASLCAGAAAPLNPAYTEPEFRGLFRDLRVDALLISSELDSPARAAAADSGLAVVEADAIQEAPAGTLSLQVPVEGGSSTWDPTGDDVALLLHTSGTTAKPKVVPLRHANLAASAQSIRRWLHLSPADRCLNVMPLFHIHGLMAALLASLSAGASVACTPGFYAPQFFDWTDELAPTWYTAVPTMHQAILARAEQENIRSPAADLRFLRSSSAPLPPEVLAQLEDLFEAPLIEAYGMTEASHQMASNPLPPADRKPGTVGLSSGTEIAIMGEERQLLPPGEIGEVVIRGPNVTGGYERNPAANAAAFVDGWFRTGDQGAVDEDGYLTIHGRLKEQINRGGEKVSPREVDEALLSHPDVAQAMAFALPDERLGEEVGAVVVLRQGAEPDEPALLRHAARSLASFKLPRRFVFLDDLPKGPTGKPQRIGLADRLGLEAAVAPTGAPAESIDPTTDLERQLVDIWQEVLKLEGVGRHDPFLSLGGDSMLATLLLSRVRERLGVDVSMVEFFEATTVAEQAALIEGRRSV